MYRHTRTPAHARVRTCTRVGGAVSADEAPEREPRPRGGAPPGGPSARAWPSGLGGALVHFLANVLGVLRRGVALDCVLNPHRRVPLEGLQGTRLLYGNLNVTFFFF